MFKLPNKLSELIDFDERTFAVSSREGKHREFKRSFKRADLSDYTKALAAFSNADGGVIIFGVSEKPRTICGIPETPDESTIADRLKEDFAPEITFSTRTYEIGTRIVLAVGVDASPHRPIICRKTRTKQIPHPRDGGQRDVTVLSEAAIYYRYTAQTKSIRYEDLANMLADRERRRMRSILESLKVVEKIGIENTAIVDLKESRSHVYISRETAKSLNFIDKGHFVEDDGAPAYIVAGTVDLNQVIHKPLEEEDKNLPKEVADKLRPLVEDVYRMKMPFSPSQVTQILRHLGKLNDDIHSILEKKLRRRYITRKGVDAVARFIKEEPLAAIRCFGSKAAIAAYETLQ